MGLDPTERSTDTSDPSADAGEPIDGSELDDISPVETGTDEDAGSASDAVLMSFAEAVALHGEPDYAAILARRYLGGRVVVERERPGPPAVART
jgi:hypothetical protein